MKKKAFQITADMFNNRYLTALMDFMAFVSPAKTENEAEIRESGRQQIAHGELGEPVKRTSANIGGKLDRNRILCGVSIFGSTPPVTEKDIKYIADAGFDFIINGNQGEYGRQILDWCEKYDIAVIGEESGEFLKKSIREIDCDNPHLFDGFTAHPASVGDTCWDEPNVKDYKCIGDFFRTYQKQLPGRFLFANLLPGCAVKSAMGTKSYTDYVDRFSAEVETDYISVDIYPFHPSKVMNKFEMAMCLKTYHTLGNACRRDGKDFWLYIQSQMRWFSHLYTMTTFEMIKWQVYASICYGCRSIIHASYNPVWGDDAIGIIDYDGNLTEQYLYVKQINREIQKLSPVIRDYRSAGVELTRAKKLNHHFVLAGPMQKIANKKAGFSGSQNVQSIESEYTALAGYFRNSESKEAVMLVNCKNIYSPYAEQKITLKLKKAMPLTVYEHGEKTVSKTADKITLIPGSCDGVFITIG